MNIRFVVWLRASSLGWFLGVPIVIALALAGEAAGIGGAQVLVGFGMGAGVGLLQGRAVRPFLGRALPWAFASAGGLALPFLFTDVAARAHWAIPYSVLWCVVAGGLIVGGWQALLLRPRFTGVAWWVVGSLAGWALAAVLAGLADSMRGPSSLRGLLGAAVYLGLVASGGVALGATTGIVLHRLQPRPTTA